jgi:hypothetical protein
MSDVHQLIQGIERLPSCKRVASTVLMNSCVSHQPFHNDDRRSKEDTLEPFKNLFALQVTACELADAGVSMPQACMSLLVSTRGGHVSMEYMPECLHQLHKISSSWDSFNHAKTRAAIICHAMRSEIDQDEKLESFRVLLNEVSRVADSVAMSDKELQKTRSMFHDIQASMRDFHVKAQSDNEELKAEIMGTWGDLQSQMQGELSKIVDRIQSMVDTSREFEDRLAERSTSVARTLDIAAEKLDDRRREDVAKLAQDLENLSAWLAFNVNMVLSDVSQQAYSISKNLTMANELTGTMAASLRRSNIEADEQIVRMEEMKMQSTEFAAIQEEHHAGTMRRFEETAKVLHVLDGIAKSIAKLWTIPRDLLHGVFRTSGLLRFGLYFCLTTGCVLLYHLSGGQSSLIAKITAFFCCVGMFMQSLHVPRLRLTRPRFELRLRVRDGSTPLHPQLVGKPSASP